MALTSQIVRQTFNANGVTTTFAIPFSIIESDDTEVKVYLRDTSTDPASETLQVLTTHYTLSGASPPTVPFDTDVVFNSAPASGLKVVIIRQLAFTQSVDVADNTEILPATTIETALDRSIALIQQLEERLDRTPSFTITSSTTNPTLTEPVAGEFLKWNAGETGIDSGNPASLSISTPSSSTDNAIVRWDGANANALQNSVVLISDTGNITGINGLNSVTATELGYVNGVTSAIQTQLNAKLSSTLTVPKVTNYISGSGTFTKTGSPLYLKVKMCGGGGGGGASGNSLVSGGTGGNTTFGASLLVANGGTGGSGGSGAGGTGGTASLGTGPIGKATSGADGQGGTSGTNSGNGGCGGSNGFGVFGPGAAVGLSAPAAVANTGAGGGGGGSGGVNGSGGGGGAGGYVEAIITSPSSTYAYSIGVAGTAGTGSTDNGAAGSAGYIEVIEVYQ